MMSTICKFLMKSKTCGQAGLKPVRFFIVIQISQQPYPANSKTDRLR